MENFEGDSVQIRISANNVSYLKLNTDKSIGACREGLVIDRSYSNAKLFFTNLKYNVVDSVEINNEFEFLYVFFRKRKFEFRFEEKQLQLE